MSQLEFLKAFSFGDIKPSKKHITGLAKKIHNHANSQQNGAAKTLVIFKALEHLIEQVQELCKDSALDELEYNSISTRATYLGAVIMPFVIKRYDYSKIPQWSKLEKQISDLKQKQKEIQDFARSENRDKLPIKSLSKTVRVELAD
jgi:hypothetical protein